MHSLEIPNHFPVAASSASLAVGGKIVARPVKTVKNPKLDPVGTNTSPPLVARFRISEY